jgi:hypothetical protein
MLVAMAAISEAGSISKLTLIPGPVSAYFGVDPENSVSIRMPETLRPERRTSFGHLMRGSRPVVSSIASETASGVMMPSLRSRSTVGRRRSVR